MGNLHAGRALSPAWIEAQSDSPRHTSLTLRLRLTFWYSAVLAFIIALFGMVVYGGTSILLIRQIDATLNGTAQTILSAGHLRSTLDTQQLFLPPLDRFGFPRTIVQIWTVDKVLKGSTDNFPYTDPLDPQGLDQQRQTYRDVVISGSRLRVLTYP